MTALLRRPTAPPVADGPAAWSIGAPRLLAGLPASGHLDLAGHLATHGPMPAAEVDKLLACLDASGLAGRGGAGFPLATKLRSLPAGGGREVIVNGTESEPASQKDRVLLHRAPHLVLDGALAVAAALGTRDVTVAVHGEATAGVLRAAVAERPDARRVRVRAVPRGFVSGEARAVVRALRGGPAVPTGRRTPPSTEGVLLSNVETFAQVAVLLRLGPHRFADTGTGIEPGTTLLTVGGAVGRPGVVEIPPGTPLGIVLAAAQAAEPHAVVIGGYHGAWHAPVPALRLSREGVRSAGGTLGAGVLLVVDRDTCALGELARVATWLAGESAHQCGPCHFGLPALAADVAAAAAGWSGAPGAAFGHARSIDGRGACAHPDGAARFVTSGLHLLHDESDRHERHGTCGYPVLGRLPIGGGR
ncbi:MAG TPA: NADH-ubiquinone oxidoreductase-F iron-sulfur binding region domain-containing protein [Jatrophihabitans sp.]|jgi:NADH:ubiquinone oxidoreductase subunit F (NADH-binding)|uniref:NADH-ubiquinone oxidoreductase-F iron-sulfur binding region domain-containing protein n=1 Tax=Jatrophihabitans sp. TaxID=1932789 RepID=UPI002DFDA154|nr:NADH-ubiquinone oxidoreductase-F iron-sulfur binding region domain-containing protein [Jatrophihabitans sp.]